jgi:hypothetical protein
VKKSLSLLNILASATNIFFNPLADKYVNVILSNANTGYAEVGVAGFGCQCLWLNQWYRFGTRFATRFAPSPRISGSLGIPQFALFLVLAAPA